jgi:hypothetical protein
MAKTPSKSPAKKVAPSSEIQQPTSTPLPRGADPAGQASSSVKAGNTAGKISRADPAQVAQRAYERYQQRGGQHGGDQDDWYAAEQELTGKSGSPGGHH